MAKDKVTESTSSLDVRRPPREFEVHAAPEGSEGVLEIVDDPGPVKKIVFEGSGVVASPPAQLEPQPEPVREEQSYRRAVSQERTDSSGSLYSIHEEVDRLYRPDANFVGAPRRANLQPMRETRVSSSTLYRTDRGGEVRAYEGPTGRTLTLADGTRERKFSEDEVDRVIQGIELGHAAPVQEEVEVEESATKPKRGLFGFIGRKPKAPEAPVESPKDDYRPQCSAVTEEGMQCRNSARGGSKYCSSHFGFQPRTVKGIHASLDTEPRHDSMSDTVPGAGWEPGQGSAQCAALTRENRQCQNPIVAGSPYCGNHQSYTQPTASELVDSLDTKPRWSKAKDTKPATRKKAKSAGSAKPKRK